MDNDQIRVDLLKFRRKAYLSYPEGSSGRKTFLKTILQNELQITKSEVPQELINLIMEGKSIVFWDTVKKVLPWLFGAVVLDSVFAYFYSTYHFHSSFIFLFLGGICFFQVFEHIQTYLSYRKSIKTVAKYSDDVKKYIDKISGDIKKLEGPK